jgi:murein DD-endopeptidase MepM/ murein hydrolase activator NlpD
MGNSAGYQIPIHLHYEVLVGDYANPKGSFGLKPVDPLSFPAAK